MSGFDKKNIINLFETLLSVQLGDIILGESPDLQEESHEDVYPPQAVYPPM